MMMGSPPAEYSSTAHVIGCAGSWQLQVQQQVHVAVQLPAAPTNLPKGLCSYESMLTLSTVRVMGWIAAASSRRGSRCT